MMLTDCIFFVCFFCKREIKLATNSERSRVGGCFASICGGRSHWICRNDVPWPGMLFVSFSFSWFLLSERMRNFLLLLHVLEPDMCACQYYFKLWKTISEKNSINVQVCGKVAGFVHVAQNCMFFCLIHRTLNCSHATLNDPHVHYKYEE